MVKIIFLLLLSVSVYSQEIREFSKSEVTLCWDYEDSAQFIVYFKDHGSNNWRKIAVTNERFATIQIPGTGSYDYGVAAVTGAYTSEIHSSLDTTACIDTLCGEDCTDNKPWFLKFFIAEPKYLRVK